MWGGTPHIQEVLRLLQTQKETTSNKLLYIWPVSNTRYLAQEFCAPTPILIPQSLVQKRAEEWQRQTCNTASLRKTRNLEYRRKAAAVSSQPKSSLSLLNMRFHNNTFLWGDCQPHAQLQNWKARVSLFIWVIHHLWPVWYGTPYQ